MSHTYMLPSLPPDTNIAARIRYQTDSHEDQSSALVRTHKDYFLLL